MHALIIKSRNKIVWNVIQKFCMVCEDMVEV